MDTKYGFTRFILTEFEQWLSTISISRVVDKVQEHHTWSPRYAQFTGNNHFEMQKGMRDTTSATMAGRISASTFPFFRMA